MNQTGNFKTTTGYNRELRIRNTEQWTASLVNQIEANRQQERTKKRIEKAKENEVMYVPETAGVGRWHYGRSEITST